MIYIGIHTHVLAKHSFFQGSHGSLEVLRSPQVWLLRISCLEILSFGHFVISFAKKSQLYQIDNNILIGSRAREEDQLAKLVLGPPSLTHLDQSLDTLTNSCLDQSLNLPNPPCPDRRLHTTGIVSSSFTSYVHPSFLLSSPPYHNLPLRFHWLMRFFFRSFFLSEYQYLDLSLCVSSVRLQ